MKKAIAINNDYQISKLIVLHDNTTKHAAYYNI